MHDPQHPAPGGHEDTLEIVGKVIAWYQQEIHAARQSPASSPGRLDQLLDEYTACVRDRERLRDATGEEAERLGALYAARLKELEAAGP
ncbi:hypothetical protein [Streptomyces sp. KS 21]|uniref:hypothetical protein n=1 Tax=Streptomyces sp. KS 21 TaxID=2485150 RepID=UPI001062749B|nr:hypothetical protein [Streptomyces sp. KS 21]TDU67104.1 hypothetical protein EDD91_8137 [Streptomyces sp. KS 21]